MAIVFFDCKDVAYTNTLYIKPHAARKENVVIEIQIEGLDLAHHTVLTSAVRF